MQNIYLHRKYINIKNMKELYNIMEFSKDKGGRGVCTSLTRTEEPIYINIYKCIMYIYIFIYTF